MDEAAILAKLTQIFRDLFDDSSLVLTRTLTAADVRDWDSANHITLVVEVEIQFGIKFHTTEIETLGNVGDLVDLIVAKLAKKSQ
jgi:acyl carrier protein